MSVTLNIFYKKCNCCQLSVSPESTIREIKKLFVSKGGNRDYSQWIYDGQILKDDQILKNVGGFDPEEMNIYATKIYLAGGLVPLTIIDMRMKMIEFLVDPFTTIEEIKKIFVSKGGEGGNNQWKYDGEIIRDNQILMDIKGYDPEGMCLSVYSNVRGGAQKINICHFIT